MAIYAIDSLTAIGPINSNRDSIYITTNGGITWNPINHPTISTADISMVTKQKLWLCTCGYDGKIYATTDGGNNWQLQFDDTSLTRCMNYIEMFDSLNGVAMGDCSSPNKPALFLRTTDGGNNWISMNQNYLIGLSSGDLWRRVDFVDINTGYFRSSGESPKKLYKTTNGGADWEVVNDTMGYPQVLKFYNENFGFVYPSPNGIYRTTDGGATWEDITIPIGHYTWGNDLEFAPSNPSEIWFVPRDYIFLSTDYGSTWIEQIHTQDKNFLDLIFIDDEYGWLLEGSYPTYSIFRTSNGGVGGLVSVEGESGNFTVSEFILEQNYPNPFNPSTKIKFTIPFVETRDRVSVRLKVYDVLGNEVSTLVNSTQEAGKHSINFDASKLASGLYIYTLNTGNFTSSKKMMLLK